MVQNHVRWSPAGCDCSVDVLVDSVTGVQTLFCIRNLCDRHVGIATPLSDAEFQIKKAQTLADRYQVLDDNRNANYAQTDAYSDIQMPPAEKVACKAQVDKITADRKAEYDRLLSTEPVSLASLRFCTNVHSSLLEENSRVSKAYVRAQSQFNLTDAQMQTITWSVSGVAPNRVFTINFGNLLTTTQKNNTQTWCNTNVGVGKVIIT